MTNRIALLMSLAVLLSGLSSAQQPVSVPQQRALPPAADSSAAASSSVIDKSPSDQLNEHLPKWLAFSGEMRFRS